MRISFLGKGGSGKTSISAAYALYLKQKDSNTPVLAVDGDVNMHMAPLLGAQQLWVHPLKDQIQAYLEPRLVADGVPIVGTLPPTTNARFIRLGDEDKFLQQFTTKTPDGLRVLTVGTYEAKDAGANCYHGKLQTLELILHRVLDTKNDRIVCDMTAGIDSLGTSMYMCSDLNIFVVEPTMKSVSVYKEFAAAALEHGLTTFVLANKIEDDADRQFITDNIPANLLLGMVAHSADMKRVEQGDLAKFAEFAKSNAQVFEGLDKKLAQQSRNHEAYLTELERVYRLNCEWWYNDFYGLDLTQYIDKNFSYAKIATA